MMLVAVSGWGQAEDRQRAQQSGFDLHFVKPIGFDTLATEIWTETSLGDYSAAAPSALLLVAVATPFVLVLSTRRAWELGAAG